MAIGALPQRALPTYAWPDRAVPIAPEAGEIVASPAGDVATYIVATARSAVFAALTGSSATYRARTSGAITAGVVTGAGLVATVNTGGSSVETVRTGDSAVFVEG